LNLEYATAEEAIIAIEEQITKEAENRESIRIAQKALEEEFTYLL